MIMMLLTDFITTYKIANTWPIPVPASPNGTAKSDRRVCASTFHTRISTWLFAMLCTLTHFTSGRLFEG